VRTAELALLALLSACVPDADPSRAVDIVRVPALLPDGRVTLIAFTRAPAQAVASPEALRQYLATSYWRPRTTAVIEARQSLSDGFAATFVRDGVRETHVIRQIGNAWFRCTGSPVADATMRDAVVAICRAHPRP